VRSFTDGLPLLDAKRIALKEPERGWKFVPEFLERRQTATVTLDCGNEGTCVKERVSEASRTRTDLVDALPAKVARNCSDPGQ
jgi:hypothetical protein